MKRTVISLIALSLLLVAATASAALVGKEVEYRDNGLVMNGYLAYDDTVKEKKPGVLVVHEWWGHNEYARTRARMLAKLGYTALAVDMYGSGKQASHPEDAGKFASEVTKNFDVMQKRFTAALEFLKAQPTVDPGRIAAIGYCFGGGVVLNMARQGAQLRGVASFHGSLAAVRPAEKGMVRAKIIVFNGGADTFVPQQQIDAFNEEMKNAGADYRFVSYPGVLHSFTNPDADEYAKKFNMKIAYNSEADQKSWKELKKFLKAVFSS